MINHSDCHAALWSRPADALRLARPESSGERLGRISSEIELQHCSTIVYAIPRDRARGLVPEGLEVEEGRVAGRPVAWLSVFSCLDQGKRVGFGGRAAAFEQTSYRIHASRDGEPGYWLLGTSLGSLAAVAERHYWPLPWHLSAMELRVSFDQAGGRYRDYRLETQSQWANGCWELGDTGEALSEGVGRPALPRLLSEPGAATYFLRRDGELGCYRMWSVGECPTRGHVKSGCCDLLASLGLLDRHEVARPHLVALQQSLRCRLQPPTVVEPAAYGLAVA